MNLDIVHTIDPLPGLRSSSLDILVELNGEDPFTKAHSKERSDMHSSWLHDI